MDAELLTTLATYAAPRASSTAIAIGIAAGALLGVAITYASGRGFPKSGALHTLMYGAAFITCGIALGVTAAHIPALIAAEDAPTPTDVATTALTAYLADAHDLTVTGPITVTTGNLEHTDIAHSPGRAVTSATTTDGQLLDVTILWNDPSSDHDDNHVTVTTRQ